MQGVPLQPTNHGEVITATVGPASPGVGIGGGGPPPSQAVQHVPVEQPSEEPRKIVRTKSMIQRQKNWVAWGLVFLLIFIHLFDLASDYAMYRDMTKTIAELESYQSSLAEARANAVTRTWMNCSIATCPTLPSAYTCDYNTTSSCCTCDYSGSIYNTDSPEMDAMQRKYYELSAPDLLCDVPDLVPAVNLGGDDNRIQILIDKITATSRATLAFLILAIPFALTNAYTKGYVIRWYADKNEDSADGVISQNMMFMYHCSAFMVSVFEDVPQMITMLYYLMYRYFPQGADCIGCLVGLRQCILNEIYANPGVAVPVPSLSIEFSPFNGGAPHVNDVWNNSALVFSITMSVISIGSSATVLCYRVFNSYGSDFSGCFRKFIVLMLGVTSLALIILYFIGMGMPLWAAMYFDLGPAYGIVQSALKPFVVLFVIGLLWWIAIIISFILVMTTGCGGCC